jgi:hypothetical protein
MRQRGPHSRKQGGRYNPNAPDFDAVHRQRFLDRLLFSGVAAAGVGTMPEWWRVAGEMAQMRAARAKKIAARQARKRNIGKRVKKWRCFGTAVKLPAVSANTKGEARAQFKRLLYARGRLPVGSIVMAA